MAADTRDQPLHRDLTRSIIASAIRVQNALGVGLLEKAYQRCLAHDLRQKGHQVLMEVGLAISYGELLVPDAFKIDLLVDELVVVEAKALEALTVFHEAQVLTYLRFSGKEVGLLLNFWACPLKKGGLQRFIHTRDQPSAAPCPSIQATRRGPPWGS